MIKPEEFGKHYKSIILTCITAVSLILGGTWEIWLGLLWLENSNG